jgi:hypothetical protein
VRDLGRVQCIQILGLGKRRESPGYVAVNGFRLKGGYFDRVEVLVRRHTGVHVLDR